MWRRGDSGGHRPRRPSGGRRNARTDRGRGASGPERARGGRLAIGSDTPIAYVTQTTLSVDDTRGVIAALRRRFTDIGDPTPATSAMRPSIARPRCATWRGSRRSSSWSARATARTRTACAKSGEVGVSELSRGGRRGARSGVVSRGRRGRRDGRPSAPEIVVDDVVQALMRIAPSEVTVLDGPKESVSFRLPAELAPQRGLNRRQGFSRGSAHGHTSSAGRERRRLCGAPAPRRPQALPAGPDAGAAVPVQPGLRGMRQDRLSGPDPDEAPLRRGTRWMRSTSAARRSSSSPAGSRSCTRTCPRSSGASSPARNSSIVCTNALLLQKKIDQYEPGPFFTWSIHLDGDREAHDRSVCQGGVYDRAVAALNWRRRRASASRSTARSSTTPIPGAWPRSSTT